MNGISTPPQRMVWLFRHGLRADWETDFAPQMVHAKDNDIAAAGVEQFEHCADYMATQPVDHLISSPYRRCIHSAEVIARKINLPIKLEWSIHESHGSEVPEVASWEESKRCYPHVDAETPSLLQPGSFEKEENWMLRGKLAIAALLTAWPGNLCIVSHGNPIVAMQQALVPGFQHLGMRCGSVSRFDLTPDGWQPGIPYSIDHLGPVHAAGMRHIDWDPAEEEARLRRWNPK